jgi:hypothetical protein
MDEEAVEAFAYLRLKLRSARSLLRDLAQAVNEAEKQLDRLESQSPKEAERESEDTSWRTRIPA